MTTPPLDTLFVGSSELAARMREADWSQTPVGVPEEWPQSVRAIIRLMLTSRYAMWMGWGPGLLFFYNDAYAHMTLGAKHPWALGKPAHEVWAEIWPDIGPRIDHVLTTGDATWDEGLLLFLERSGFSEETYHTFSYSPLHRDDGEVAGIFCVVTEETERVIGERRLALLREVASQLAASQTMDDVWTAAERSMAGESRDLPFTLTYLVGDRADAATLVASSNVPAGDPIARDVVDLDDGMWPIRRVIEHAMLGPAIVDLPAGPRGPWPKAPTQAMVLPIAQQGQVRPAGVFIAGLNPYRPIDAEYRSFVALYVAQIAAGLANAQAYAAEHRRAEALAQVDRAKTTFFSNVSHELRTPLTLILDPLEDALSADTPALAGEALDLVYRNGLRLRKLVNTILDFSRIEAGRVDATYEPVDLALYTAELASTFRSVVERAGLRLVVRCVASDERTFIDRDMWEKVVLNLLSNALKFTFVGEMGVEVVRSGEHMRVRVSDTGTGIPPAELPRVFERFHRVEGAIGRSHEGTGIGLALVHELVKLHGGAIEVESEFGRGTTFTVTIPLGMAHLPAEQVSAGPVLHPVEFDTVSGLEEVGQWVSAGDRGDADLASVRMSCPPPPERGRILLADDNADMRSYLQRLLGERWFVELATDGRDAVERALRHPPDLVITDVMMPKLDGFGVLRELKLNERTRRVPVMMLSARAGEGFRVEGYEAGADDYLVKPFTSRELMARVDAQLLRSRMQRVEERSAGRIASVFAKAPVPIAIVRGPDHVFELANDACLALVQRPLVGRRLLDACPELTGQEVVEILDRVYATGEPFVVRPMSLTLNLGPNGAPTTLTFDVACQPLFDHDGVVEGIAAVAYELSELANARQAAESANRAKDEFLAMLGHELRNPLAPIVTALQLLRMHGESGERERTIIERQVRHLIGLVDDLLDISRITRGKVRLNPEPSELNDIVAKAIELASPLLEQQRHDFEVELPRHGLGVMADPTRLAQVVSNLLANAAKYTPPGGHIQVLAEAVGDEVVLRVRDDGMGIDPAMLPLVFDLFAQDRQARIDRAQGGLGLGLAIVRSLVTLHGGSVAVYSEGRGRGSEFVVRLPLIKLGEAAGVDQTARAHAVDSRQSGPRVLVVDDNEDAATMMAAVLAAHGYVAVTAPDGPTALEKLCEFHPDVALVDIGLPVMDGFEFARHFRAMPELSDARLVAVTGYGQEQDRQRSTAAGFDAHLVKPVDIEQLTQLLRQLLLRADEIT